MNYPQPVDVWLPRAIVATTNPDARGAHQFFAVARLKNGVTVARAREDVKALARRLGEQYPDFDLEFSGTVNPLQEQMVGNLRTTLFSILGAVGLRPAHCLRERREPAARARRVALRRNGGAYRPWRAERTHRSSAADRGLAAHARRRGDRHFGGGVGGARDRRVGPRLLPRLQDVSVNGRVLAVSAVVSVFTGVVFGLVPALYAARPNIASMLRENLRGSSRGGVNRLRAGLVVAEMALAVVLLIGAGLLIKSFVALSRVNPGFEPRTSSHSISRSRRRSMRATRRSSPRSRRGRPAAGVARNRTRRRYVGTPARAYHDDDDVRRRRRTSEGPDASNDHRSARRIAVVLRCDGNDAQARSVLHRGREPSRRPSGIGDQRGAGASLLPEPEPRRQVDHPRDELQQRRPNDTAGVSGEIVGVVADVRQRGLSAELFPSVFLPYNVFPGAQNSIVMRTRASRVAVETAVRAQVREVDPRLPVIGLSTMEQVVADSVAQPRFYMTMFAVFAGNRARFWRRSAYTA